MQGSIPSDLTDTLTTTLALLSAPRDLAIYHRLAQCVSAFDKDGDPAVELIEKPPSRFAVLLSRALADIPRITLVVSSIVTTIAILIALILALRHRMNVDELLRYLR